MVLLGHNKKITSQLGIMCPTVKAVLISFSPLLLIQYFYSSFSSSIA